MLFFRYCSLGDRRLSKLSKYIARSPLFAYATQWMMARTINIIQIYNTLVSTYSSCRVLCMKMPLYYGICIRSVSCCSYTLVVTSLGIRIAFLTFFFPRDSSSMFVWGKIKFRDLPWRGYFNSSSWCATLLSFTAFATPAAPTNEPIIPNKGRIDRIPSRFAIRSTRLFVVLFFLFFFFLFSNPFRVFS